LEAEEEELSEEALDKLSDETLEELEETEELDHSGLGPPHKNGISLKLSKPESNLKHCPPVAVG
jgi:hypothetical protein